MLALMLPTDASYGEVNAKDSTPLRINNTSGWSFSSRSRAAPYSESIPIQRHTSPQKPAAEMTALPDPPASNATKRRSPGSSTGRQSLGRASPLGSPDLR